MTTDLATRLAAALPNTVRSDSHHSKAEVAAAILAADPTIEQRYELGRAWQEAEAALPEGWAWQITTNYGHVVAFAWESGNKSKTEIGIAAKPDATAALDALTAALKGEKE